MNNSHSNGTSPNVFDGSKFKVIEYKNIDEALDALQIFNDIGSVFERAAIGHGAIKIIHPVQELEYGLYAQTVPHLQSAPALLGHLNPNIRLQANPDRNFQYLTLSYATDNSKSPLHSQYVMQWRIDVSIVNGEPVMNYAHFCIKTRGKSLERGEWEVKTNHLNLQDAYKSLREKYGDDLPDNLQIDPQSLALEVFISSCSATSRSGFSAPQARPKWNSTVFHKFSNDFQLACAPDLVSKKGHLKALARRLEFEDEVEGFTCPSDEFLEHIAAIPKGALDTNRGRVISAGLRVGKPYGSSRLSKAIFGEKAVLGQIDKVAIPEDNFSIWTTDMSHLKLLNIQADEYFTNPALKAGIVMMLERLPAKGALYTPDDPDRILAVA